MSFIGQATCGFHRGALRGNLLNSLEKRAIVINGVPASDATLLELFSQELTIAQRIRDWQDFLVCGGCYKKLQAGNLESSPCHFKSQFWRIDESKFGKQGSLRVLIVHDKSKTSFCVLGDFKRGSEGDLSFGLLNSEGKYSQDIRFVVPHRRNLHLVLSCQGIHNDSSGEETRALHRNSCWTRSHQPGNANNTCSGTEDPRGQQTELETIAASPKMGQNSSFNNDGTSFSRVYTSHDLPNSKTSTSNINSRSISPLGNTPIAPMSHMGLPPAQKRAREGVENTPINIPPSRESSTKVPSRKSPPKTLNNTGSILNIGNEPPRESRVPAGQLPESEASSKCGRIDQTNVGEKETNPAVCKRRQSSVQGKSPTEAASPRSDAASEPPPKRVMTAPSLSGALREMQREVQRKKEANNQKRKRLNDMWKEIEDREWKKARKEDEREKEEESELAALEETYRKRLEELNAEEEIPNTQEDDELFQ